MPTTAATDTPVDSTMTDGDASGDPVDTASIDACALLTNEEISAILGTVPEGSDEDLGFDAACYWETATDDDRLLELSVELGELGELAADEYASWQENVTVIEESVAVGDEAFLALYSVGGSSLVVRQGGLLLFINTSVEGHEETLKDLGPVVLGRFG